MKQRWVVMGWLVLACASSTPAPQVQVSAKRAPAPDVAFPPTGPVELRAQPAPSDGTLYRLLMSYDGRTELTPDNTHEAEVVDEKVSLQIDYRQMPVATPVHDEPAQNDLASSLILLALNRRARTQPPGTEHLLEIGDDRLRTQANNKVDTDLRGAQPKQDLTPRSVIGKSFALVVDDAAGDPKGVTIHGTPPAKRMLATLPLRESLAYLQIAFPNRAVSPGDTWHGKRFLPNPIGKLGLAVDVEYRLVGFERISDAPCAHVVMRAHEDSTTVRSEAGFQFSEVRYSLTGDAWLDLATGQVAEARIEDGAAIAYKKTALAVPVQVRMRYEGRSGLQRLDSLQVETTWADGTKKFSAVK